MRIRNLQRTMYGALGLGSATVLAAAAPGDTGAAEAAWLRCESAVTEQVSAAYDAWVELWTGRDEMSESAFDRRADSWVRETFALDAVGRRIFRGDDWDRLGARAQEDFMSALARSVRSRLVSEFEGLEDLPRLRPSSEDPRLDGDLLRVSFHLVNQDRDLPLSVHVVMTPEGPCTITDIRGGGEEFLRDTRNRVNSLVGDYSFSYMLARLGDYDHVVLEDFESTPEGELPLDWTWRGGDNDKNKPYRVVSENGNQYLEATDEGESVILGRRIRWDLDEYPYVSFRVRVWRIPEGGDERYDDLVDSAAGVYVTLKKKFFGKIPEVVKYVWSSTLPVGSAVRREGIGKPWQVVMGTGTDGLGEWRTYVFDVRQAYLDTFGGLPPDKPEGIGVLSDANSLRAQAYADYDDFRALRDPPPGVTSGVFEILPPLGRANGDSN